MSEMYNSIDKWYNSTPQFWNIDRVWNAVGRAITETEYQEITGFAYPAKSGE